MFDSSKRTYRPSATPLSTTPNTAPSLSPLIIAVIATLAIALVVVLGGLFFYLRGSKSSPKRETFDVTRFRESPTSPWTSPGNPLPKIMEQPSTEYQLSKSKQNHISFDLYVSPHSSAFTAELPSPHSPHQHSSPIIFQTEAP